MGNEQKKEISDVICRYLLIGRYEKHGMNSLTEDERTFIRAIRLIHIIGFISTMLRNLGILNSVHRKRRRVI